MSICDVFFTSSFSLSALPPDISLLNEVLRAYSVAGEMKKAEDVSDLFKTYDINLTGRFPSLHALCITLV